ncbi:hypothetical protein NOSIN_13205 [Nocardiopsis sinuspersici]|uniref:argininosuccinate synthase n=1 Tax=Nocardiopsis sinuspersici TaxID=501010 RepID=A0A1V3C1N1_9ACTN|nr:hypothetical protein NOSIN_13205 [Nocardiopsis sinuspersici]
MDRYPLVSVPSRPLIVKHLADAARYHGTTMVAHGCTGRGNDQVRLEAGLAALLAELRVPAPVRGSGVTRDRAIAFAEDGGPPIDVSRKSPHSIDQNLFGRAVETGFLEDIRNGPVEDLYDYTQDPAQEREPDELVYDGLWFSPLKDALRTFVTEANKNVTGDIRMVLHGGRAVVTGRRSEASLYDYGLATYDTGDTYDQSLARGFIDVFGMPAKIAHLRDQRRTR